MKKFAQYTAAGLALVCALAPIYWLVTISLKREIDQFASPPLWFGFTPWPRAVDEFHQRIQPEASGRAHIELLAAAAFAAAALAALRPKPATGSVALPVRPGRRG